MVVGIIYKIEHKNLPITYVGSSTNSLRHRFNKHKWEYSQNKSNISIFEYFDVHGLDNFQMKLIKKYDIVDIKHLRAYEQLWINKIDCVNKHLAFSPFPRSYKILCPCGGKSRISDMARHRKSKRHVRYLNSGKKKMLKKITCPCGSIVLLVSYKAHLKTNKHKLYLESIEMSEQ